MDAQLEIVLEAYATTEPGPSRAALTAWIRDYPQFARELTDFTAQWQLLEWAGDATTSAENERATDAESDVIVDEEEHLILRGISAAQSVFYARRAKRLAAQVQEARVAQAPSRSASAPATIDTPINNLLAAAKRVGLSYADLRERVGLSDGLLRKIDRRLIDPLTIPARVLTDLAGAVQHNVTAVTAYTRLAPTFAPGAQHRANQAPALPPHRENFFDAVRKDLTLDESRRRELLALPRPGTDDLGGTDEG